MTETNACRKIVPDMKGVYQGAFVDDSVSEESVIEFEKKSGQRLDIALRFMAFATGLQFPENEALVMAKRNGAIFIKLEPWSWRGSKDDSFSLENIMQGKYDHLLKRFAEGAKKFGKPVFVSFGHEMNGNWYPWSGDPSQFVKAYRYVHDKISKEYGACNITWVWNPNIDFGNLQAYYPGEGYVDWVAADGYNTQDWGSPWRSFEALYSDTLDVLEAFKKPIMIGEFACDANDLNDERVKKPQFLSSAISSIAQDKRIKAYIYFDIDKNETGGEKQWRIDTPESIKAYHDAVIKYEELFRRDIQTAVSGNNSEIRVEGPTLTKVTVPVLNPAAFDVRQIVRSTIQFNGGSIQDTGSSYVFSADRVRDAGVILLAGNADISKFKVLKFDIKGSVTKHGQYARLIAQIYSDSDNDYTPSVILDPITVKGSFSSVSLDLNGQVKKVKKIQFMLITDEGSCNVEIKNLRLE